MGVPIKASDFYSKPTLGYLEGKFAPNESARQSYKARIKNTIDVTFLKRPGIQLQGLIKTLDKEEIQTVLRQNEDGIIYGITYVDNHTKCIFNGSALGKPYSAKGILERCGEVKETLLQKQDIVKQSRYPASPTEEQTDKSPSQQNKNEIDLLETLLQPEYASGYVPNGLPGKGRKKKKKRITKRL